MTDYTAREQITEVVNRLFVYTDAQHGNTRDFVGSYDLKLRWNERGWRIHRLPFNLNISGNDDLS